MNCPVLYRGFLLTAAVCYCTLSVVGCGTGVPLNRPAGSVTPPIRSWEQVEDLPAKMAVFETVFWEPRDSTSLRELIRETDLVRGQRVLEIGTGSGLISLCCLQAGAARVVATDVNPQAVANAEYNAQRLGLDPRLEVRRVPLDDAGAFAVIAADERFDLIISNPPWEDQLPREIAEYALYDPGFALLESLLAEARDHLRPGGRVFLAYGCVEAIETVQRLAGAAELEVTIRDQRKLADLPAVFLPGMLLELRLR